MTQGGNGVYGGQRPPQGPPQGPPGGPPRAAAQPPKPSGPEGRYKGKAIDWAFGRTGTGLEQIAVVYELTEGEFSGKQYTWYGFFNSPENFERTAQSLMFSGWDGQDFRALTGMGSKIPSLTIESEFYAPPGKPGAWRFKIQWVNDPDSDGIAMKDRYSPNEVADFASRMNGQLAELRAKLAAKGAGKPMPTPSTGGGGQQQPPAQQPEDPMGDDSIPF
jgi:hypothetical protein